MRAFYLLVIIGIILTLVINLADQTNVEIVNECTVIELQQQQLISGTNGDLNTEIRYLVVTDKETFVCETSFINNKFNNSDIFWRLEKGKTYNFRVSGFGKTVITQYRNILEIVK